MFINPTNCVLVNQLMLRRFGGGEKKFVHKNIGIVELRAGKESSQITGQVVLEFGILK